MRRVTLLLFCVVTLLSFGGCGGGTDFGPMAEVSGKLTMDGEVMAPGTQLLFMQMKAGYAAFGATDEQGNYSLTWAREGTRRDELPTGTYKVLIQPPAAGSTEEMSPEEMLAGEDHKPAEPEFPAKYQRHTTSGLEYTLKEGENEINIDLQSE